MLHFFHYLIYDKETKPAYDNKKHYDDLKTPTVA